MRADRKSPPRDPVTGEIIPEEWRGYNHKQILQAKCAQRYMKVGNPWRGWHPTTKEYDPNDPHFNPMHPPKGYPQDLLEAEWEEPEVTIVEETINGKTRTKYIFRRKEGND